jgi:hypothetical protein
MSSDTKAVRIHHCSTNFSFHLAIISSCVSLIFLVSDAWSHNARFCFHTHGDMLLRMHVADSFSWCHHCNSGDHQWLFWRILLSPFWHSEDKDAGSQKLSNKFLNYDTKPYVSMTRAFSLLRKSLNALLLKSGKHVQQCSVRNFAIHIL